MATKKSAPKKSPAAGAAAATVFNALSHSQLGSLRAAKQAASQQFLAPAAAQAQASALAAAAPTSPAPSSNVVGVGLGEQISGGKHTGLLAIKFLVRIKYPENQIPAGE